MTLNLEKISAILSGTARTVLDLKGTEVNTITPDATVYAAIEMMEASQVGALFVMDGADLVGVISERDYARKVILQGRASKDTRVDAIMTSPVITIDPTTPLSECMRLVNERGIRHLPVVADGQIIGVISIRDIVFTVALQQAELIAQLNSMLRDPYPG